VTPAARDRRRIADRCGRCGPRATPTAANAPPPQ